MATQARNDIHEMATQARNDIHEMATQARNDILIELFNFLTLCTVFTLGLNSFIFETL
jgi:hypothetical protein